MIGAFLLGSVVARASWSAAASWWELLVPAALIALFPVIEWVVHVAILHWRPRSLGPVTIDSLLARDHRAHHADPRDLPLVFIPWRALVWLLPAYVVVALLAMPTASSALTLLVSVYAIMAGYEWTHYLIHSDYRPRSRVVPLGVAQPPAAPLQERALLVHRHQRRHRRPAVRHLPRPDHGGEVTDRKDPARRLSPCPSRRAGFPRRCGEPTPPLATRPVEHAALQSERRPDLTIFSAHDAVELDALVQDPP